QAFLSATYTSDPTDINHYKFYEFFFTKYNNDNCGDTRTFGREFIVHYNSTVTFDLGTLTLTVTAVPIDASAYFATLPDKLISLPSSQKTSQTSQIMPTQIVQVPVNIETQNMGKTYQQLGILTKHGNNTKDGNPIILPLMGKKNIRNSNRWKYYTVHNGGSQLPISKGGLSCTKEQGCDEIYSGDLIYVEGFQETFIATVYDLPTLEYIPYISQ
ncbi:MAG: hypothetical protein EBS86_14765, partial [Crocinitomicaceae bacterium]|nr:hypothetical protein [Crocinitomicaceae bacterium]